MQQHAHPAWIDKPGQRRVAEFALLVTARPPRVLPQSAQSSAPGFCGLGAERVSATAANATPPNSAPRTSCTKGGPGRIRRTGNKRRQETRSTPSERRERRPRRSAAITFRRPSSAADRAVTAKEQPSGNSSQRKVSTAESPALNRAPTRVAEAVPPSAQRSRSRPHRGLPIRRS